MPPALHYAEAQVGLWHGDCLDVLRTLDDASVDAVVTDPPYELAFMGRQWDSTGIAYNVDLWRECLRILRPGGHLAAFGGARTYHRMACAVEDARFEIRDGLQWIYGSGFPKSLDVSKAIDKQRDDRADIVRVTSWLAWVAEARGVSRADVDAHMGTSDMGGWWLSRLAHRCQVPTWEQWGKLRELLAFSDEMDAEVWRLNGRKGTPGEAWEQREVIGQGVSGIGTAFGDGQWAQGKAESFDLTAPATPAALQWSGWGTGIAPGHEPIVLARKPLAGTVAQTVLTHGTGAINVEACKTSEGRWPKNVIIDEHVAADLGDHRARYFYCAKAPTSERPKVDGVAHSTVKPLALMRWLVRLVTPPGGTVLDPFAGSGTTLQAGRDEGFNVIGVEREAEYLPLIVARLSTSTQSQLAV